MSEPIVGSIEIRHNDGTSEGVQGTNWTVDAVPLVLGVLKGIIDMVVVTPEQQQTGRTPAAQWTGKDRNAQNVTVFLWPEVPFAETYAAQIGPLLANLMEALP